MRHDRLESVIIGALFLIAMGTSMVGDGMIESNLGRADYLVALSENRNQVITGALLWLLDGFAVVAIAVFLYPHLKRSSQSGALGYVGLRVAELGLILIYLLTPLVMLGLEDGDPAHLAGGSVLLDSRYWSLQLIYLFNGVAGATLCILLYRANTVPRIISVVGLIGYAVLLPASVLELFGALTLAEFPGLLVFLPGSLFEILLFPVWLFARGLSRPAEQTAN
jgi:hypothetical protein